MVKKVFAAVVVLLVMVQGAWAEEIRLVTIHRSIADFVNGKPDYSTARFLGLWIAATKYDTPATQADVNLTGTMTFSGGSYSFWDGKNGMRKISGTPQTFNIAGDFDIGSYSLEYMPKTASDDLAMFCLEADSGLNGVNISWNFPSMQSYNGQGTFPNYRTTQQQLDSYVPYVEYIGSGSQVTGLRVRVVRPNNTSEPAALDFAPGFRVFQVRDASGNSLYTGQWTHVEAGNPAQIEVTFNSPINESDISTIRVGFRNDDYGPEPPIYQWDFNKPSEHKPYLWAQHISRASLINGKADYSDAEFTSIFLDVEASDGIVAEADYFTAEGSITIPGGGYSLRDDDRSAELGIDIPAGTDRTFKLRMLSSVALGGSSYVEYHPIDDNGVNLNFSKNAETNLPGKTVTWTFPAELDLADGSGTIPSYKTTASQLASGVPYIELVSADGKITAVNYKIVTASDTTASDTSTAITPSYQTDFRIIIVKKTNINHRYNSGWLYNRASGTWTLDNPQELSELRNIHVRLRSYEDANNPYIYSWNFYPASVPSSPAITTSSLPAATINTPYTTTLATNISGATWSISSGTLPANLTLDSSKGTISGTPITSGDYPITVKAESGTQSAEKSFTLTVSSGGKDVGVGGGGGCSSFPAIFALALAFILSKKR